jgi:hypothetical protein
MMFEQQLKRAHLSGQAFALQRHRAALAKERDDMLGQLAAEKAAMLGDYLAMRDRLQAMEDELLQLKMLHAQSQAQRAEIARMRALATFAAAQPDANTLWN